MRWLGALLPATVGGCQAGRGHTTENPPPPAPFPVSSWHTPSCTPQLFQADWLAALPPIIDVPPTLSTSGWLPGSSTASCVSPEFEKGS